MSIQRVGFVSRVGDVLVIALAIAALVAVMRDRRPPSVPNARVVTDSSYFDDWASLALAEADTASPHVRGVRLVAFVDYECPSCAVLHRILTSLEARYRDSIHVTILHFPLRQHPAAVAAANAAECARDQGRFAEMNAGLYREAESVRRGDFWQIARKAGISDSARFNRCTAASDTLARVAAGIATASRLGLPGTPALILEGWLFTQVPTEVRLHKMIERELISMRAQREPEVRE